MRRRTLMNDEEWLVKVGFFGLGAVRVRQKTGRTVTASFDEKRFLSDLLEILHRQGAELDARSPVMLNMLRQFAAAIHQPRGSALYNAFFRRLSLDRLADYYLHQPAPSSAFTAHGSLRYIDIPADRDTTVSRNKAGFSSI